MNFGKAHFEVAIKREEPEQLDDDNEDDDEESSSTPVDRTIEDSLIEIVRRYKHLWWHTTAKTQYEQDGDRLTSWNDIGRMLNITTFKCKTKWKNLRDGYIRRKKEEKRKMNGCGKSTKSGKIIKWRYWKSLSFLEPTILHMESASPRASSASCNQMDLLPSPANNLADSVTTAEFGAADVGESENSIASQDVASSGGEPYIEMAELQQQLDEKSTVKSQLDCVMLDALKSWSGGWNPSSRESRSNREEDEDFAFGNSVAFQLKSLRKSTKSKAKFKIQQVLFEAEQEDEQNNQK